jgi:hypothetical protein
LTSADPRRDLIKDTAETRHLDAVVATTVAQPES